MLRRWAVGGVAILIAFTLVAEANAANSTNVQFCQGETWECEETASVPVGENLVVGTALGLTAELICTAPSKTPVEGVGDVGVCDPPTPYYAQLRTLLRAKVGDQELALESYNRSGALISSYGLGLRLNDRRVMVETGCSSYPDAPGTPPSYCAPFGLLETP